MLKVIVDRERWLRGEGSNASALYREDGKMCCMGFAAIAAGYKKSDLLGLKSIHSLEIATRQRVIVAPENCSITEDENNLKYHPLYVQNDAGLTTDAEKEETLIRMGKKVGIEFSFV
jgi:hypothetical protein